MTTPIKEAPKELRAQLRSYRHLLSKPQYANLTKYITGLITVEKNRTVERINQRFIDKKDPSSLNRFLTESPLPLADLNASRLKSVFRAVRPSQKDLLIIDDTLAHKTGKKMQYAAFHHDGMSGELEWGHNLVFSYCSGEKMSYPVSYDLYVQEDQCSSDWSFHTKLELAARQVRWAKEHGFRGDTAVFDTAYMAIEFVHELKYLRMKHVSSIKENRRITVDKRHTHAGEYFNTLKPDNFKIIKVNGSTYQVHEKEIYIPHIGKEKLLITQRENEKESRFIVTDHLDWTAEQIIKAALRRWEIEEFHRDAKQNLGLEDYRCRVSRGVLVHVLCVLIAYTLLVTSQQKLGQQHLVADTIGKLCQWVRDLILEIYTNWVRTLKSGFKYVKRRFGVLS